MKKTLAVSVALAAVLSGTAAAQRPPMPLVSYEPPIVPELLTDGVAIVAFTVRANGRVADAVTLSATERSIGFAAKNAVLKWRFERDPELGTGRAADPSRVIRREIIEFIFKRDGVVSSLSHAEGAKSWFPANDELVVRTVLPDELDRPLERLPVPASRETRELLDDLTVAGRAIVSFVIDETGAVRVPAVITADDPALEAPALAVVAEWTYTAPTAGGKAVLVDERNSLTFRPRNQ